MNSFGTETAPSPGPAGGWWVVGYGNVDRRDDGLGPAVVAGLAEALPPDPGVRLLSRPHLDLDLVEDLKEARRLILVDATVEPLDGGFRLEPLAPDLAAAPFLTHHLQPDFILGLLGWLHGRRPEAYLVSIQGDDFGLGPGLSAAAEGRAGQVVAELVNLVAKEV